MTILRKWRTAEGSRIVVGIALAAFVVLLLALVISSHAVGQTTLFAAPAAPAPLRALSVSARSGPATQTPNPAVVRVISPERNGASLGSGTLVDVSEKHGLVITNWHVVKDAAGNVIVSFPDGFQTPGYVIKMDRDWDLAAVAIWRPRVQPVPIAAAIPRRGDLLTIAGYGRGEYKAQTGRCTQYYSPGAGLPFDIVELSAAARHGDSGGPMFNSRGELAGVLFGEGGGMTSGSASARVRWFLESIGYGKTVPEPATQIAAAPARASGEAASEAPGNLGKITETDSPWQPASNLPSPLADFGERSRTGEGPGVRDQDTSPTAIFKATTQSPSSNYLVSVPPPTYPATTYPTTNTPAQTRLPQVPPASPSADPFAPPQPPPAAITLPADSAAQSATQQIGWEDLAGHTPGQQLKTFLAALGVLMVLYQLSRRIA